MSMHGVICFQRYVKKAREGTGLKRIVGFNVPWKQDYLENVVRQLFPDESIINVSFKIAYRIFVTPKKS